MVGPPRSAGWRQGVALALEVGLGEGQYALFADSALTTSPKTTADGFSTTLDDVPVGVGALRWWRVGSVSLAAGPRVALHLFDATAVSADGRGGASRRLSAGAGAVARLEVALARRLRAYTGLATEVIVPAQKFTVSAEPAIDTGRFLLGASAGLALSVL